MNLDQLALQCYEECGDYHLGSVPQFNHKKFAESIIKECVEVAYKYDEPKLSGPGLMIGTMIEEHFGVE